MTTLVDHPAHDRIRKANNREGGRHLRHVPTDSRPEVSCGGAWCCLVSACPSCAPSDYAPKFARHRAWEWL